MVITNIPLTNKSKSNYVKIKENSVRVTGFQPNQTKSKVHKTVKRE